MSEPMMTPDEIAAATVLCEKATPGPWQSKAFSHSIAFDKVDQTWPPCAVYGELGGHDREADAAFIIGARTLLPKALASLTEVYKRIDALRDCRCAAQCGALPGDDGIQNAHRLACSYHPDNAEPRT